MRILLGFCCLLVSGLCIAQELRIASLAPEGTAWMREMRAAGDEVAKRTEGRVRLKYFPGGVMGNDATVLRKMRLGQLQGGALTGSELSAIYPDAQIYGLPFLFASDEEAQYVRSKVDAQLIAGFERHGMLAAGLSSGGFSYLMGTRSIADRDELVRTKVWVPNNDKVAMVTFDLGGIQPVPLSLADVYTALQTGLVETVGNTMSGTIAFQWHTRVRFVADLPVTYVLGFLVIDQKALRRVSAEDQQILREAVGAAFARLDASNRADNLAARASLEREGINFQTMSPETIRSWSEIGDRAALKLVADGAISRPMLDAVLQARSEFRAGSAAQ